MAAKPPRKGKPRKGKGKKPPIKRFTRVTGKVPAKKLVEIKERITRALLRAEMVIPFPGRQRVKVHANKDGTIDGTLRVHLPRGVRADKLLRLLSDALPPVSVAWISITVLIVSQGDDEAYPRLAGMISVSTNWQRATKAKIGTNFLTARKIVKILEKRRRRKVQTVIVNLHWNAEGKKPPRR